MTHSAGQRSVLILGNYRPTLTVARTLSGEGYRIIVSSSDSGAAGARYSRFVDELWDHPPVAGSAEFGAALRGFLERRNDVFVVFPVAEEFTVWLAAHQALLPDGLVVVSPAPELVRTCLDKTAMLELADSFGVKCARHATAAALDDFHSKARQAGFPVIVRPLSHLNRIGHKKAVICRNEEDLLACFPVWPEGQSGLIVQRYVNGPRHDLYFVAIGGPCWRPGSSAPIMSMAPAFRPRDSTFRCRHSLPRNRGVWWARWAIPE